MTTAAPSPRTILEQAWALRRSDPPQARALAEPYLDDPDVAPMAQTVLYLLAQFDAQRAELLHPATETAELLRARNEREWHFRALGIVATTYQALGQRDTALAIYQEMLTIADELGDLAIRGSVLQDIGVLWYISDRDKAAAYFREAIAAFEVAGNVAQASLANTCVNLGGLEYQAGRQAEGVALIERGRDLALATGSILTWVNGVCYMAEVHTERGDVAIARRELQAALERFPVMPGNTRLTLLKTAGIVEYLAGEHQRALDAFERLRDFELVQFDQQHLLQMKAESLAHLGRFGEAYTVSQELVVFNEALYKGERESALLKLEERHQADTARREADLRRLEAEAAQRDAELKHLENVELQRALESNAILIQSLRESQQVSDTLLGVSHLMQLDLDPHDLARYALSLVTQVVDTDWAALVRLVSHDVTVEPLWARHPAGETFTRHTLPGLLHARHPLLHRSARSDEPTFLTRASAGDPSLLAPGLRDVASLPAGTTQATTYVLLLGRLGPERRWTDREQHVLGATGRALRAAIETQEQTRRTQEAALTDVLTGLPNRRAFEADLKDAGSAPGFSVAMLDVDGLKRVNDTRGHAAGDRLLQVFGAALRAHAPDGVRVYRLGGDELALLTGLNGNSAPEPFTAQVQALVASGVRALQAAGFAEAGCSFGVARWPQEATTPTDVVALADTRLYAHKEVRRGQAGTAVHARDREVRFGDAVLDVLGRVVRGPLGEARLTPREADVLYLLATGAPGVVTRVELSEGAADASGALDVHLSNLRRKLAGVTAHAGIRTARGQGFSLQWYGPHDD